MDNLHYLPGTKFDDVILEIYTRPGWGIPEARAVTHLPPDMQVWLYPPLLQEFPVGTRFRAKGAIQQLRRKDMEVGKSQLRFMVEHATAIVDSIPDENLKAILNEIKADSSTTLVRNCPSAFKCDKTWDELAPIETAGVQATNIRHCGDCQKNVYLCETIGEICAATKEGKCVAVMAATVVDPHADAEDFVGYIEDN